MKRLLMLILALAMLLAAGHAAAEAVMEFQVGDYLCRGSSDGTVTIIDYTGSENGELVIPSELDGRAVTGIGEKAFYEEDMTSVILPESVTYIGDEAFYFCSKLRKLLISENVTYIGDYAFAGCRLTDFVIPEGVQYIGDAAFCYTEMSSVTIPDSVTAMGENPFYACTSLKSFNVSPEQPAFAVIDGVLFKKESKELVCYPEGKDGDSYTIPDGIISIADDAFAQSWYASKLKNITLPDSLVSIGHNAFYQCDELQSIVIPEGVVSIGDYAFYACYGLQSVTIPDSVTSVGIAPFDGCEELTIHVSPDQPILAVIDNVLFNKGKKELIWYPRNKEDNAYEIPQGIESVGDRAFRNNDDLMSVIMPDSVTSIGPSAFSGCKKLESVTLPEGLTAIESYTFYDCESLWDVTIPDSVTVIESDAFWFCSALKELNLPSGVEYIADGAFGGCDDLTFTVTRDTYAAQWCKEKGYTYVYEDALDWLNN